MTRAVIVLAVAAAMTMGAAVASAFECPARPDETRVAVQKAEAALDRAKAAAKAAARGPLGKVKEPAR
jgi:Na+-transporting methylmalonyl-CoA/oxaloacetate decarboxylase gamma subunit